MPHLNEHYEAWIGRMLTDALGHKVGKIDDIYTDDDTGQPEWLAVTIGLMGSSTHFVPMRGATDSAGGVQVPFPKDQVKVAPGAGADGRLSRMEKGRLYAHYGYSYAEERNRLQLSLGFDAPGLSRPGAGHDVSPPVDLRNASGPAAVGEVRIPADRLDVPERLPPAGGGEGRGRWPDDEAIFGLSQEVSHPTLAASAGSRRR